MRILVISQLPPFVIGGAERQASRLISEWQRAGHEVICLGRSMRGRGIDIDGRRIPVHRIRVIQRMGRMLRGLSYSLSLTALLLRYRCWPHVIYCRFFGEAAATVSVLKRFGLLTAPLIAVPANAGPKGDIGFLRSVPLHRNVVRVLERQCNAINLIAPRMADDLRDLGLSGRQFRKIPNGIALTPLPDRRWHGPRRVITVGRLADQKHLDLLLQAFANVRRQGHEAELRIVGDGPLRADLERLAHALGIANCTEFTGVATEAQVQIYLAEAHVFVLPSRYEGFSNAALEAMERGLPVILSRCGGLDQYIRPDMGWVVEQGDSGSLESALAVALSAAPATLAGMGAKCRTEVERRFDIQAIAAQNVDLFRELLSSDPHS